MKAEYDKDDLDYLVSRDMSRKVIRQMERNRLRKGTSNEKAAVIMAECGYGVEDIAGVTRVSMETARRLVTGE